ncbi:MAG: DUF2813 domain-containing protein [Phycisphaerales bacterium]
MHLAFVSVQNYRGLQALELTLGPLTTLIGENSYGKSNLLDALLAVLGPGSDGGGIPLLADDFRDDDHGGFHPIELRLGFRESSEGEWRRPPFTGLEQHVWHGPNGDRRLELRVFARRSGDPARVETSLTFVDGADKQVGPVPPPALVECVRKHVPMVLLKADRYFTRPSRADETEHRAIDLESRLAEEIGSLLGGLGDMHRPQVESEVQRGVEAAIEYVKRFGGDRLRRRMGPLLASGGHGIGASSTSRAIALLLILGPILAQRTDIAFGPDCHPIIAIEDAEAHLHPIMLSSVASVIRATPAQRIVTTNSGDLLAMLPLQSVRRIVREGEATRTFRIARESLSEDELRRIMYHVRANRGTSLFARAWLLVEGETEFWLLPELAAHLGIDFGLEGIRCMEFAQCGVAPLVKLANEMGIHWHLLADGDPAGASYAAAASEFVRPKDADAHITRLPDRDIEHSLWRAGYADIYRHAMGTASPRRLDRRPKVENPTPTIERALRARSKPGMAVAVADAVRAPNSPGVPPPLRHAIEATASLARGAMPFNAISAP